MPQNTYGNSHGGAFWRADKLAEGVPTDMTANVSSEQALRALYARNSLFLRFIFSVPSTGRVTLILTVGLVAKK